MTKHTMLWGLAIGVWIIAACKFVLHFAASFQDGFFVDELYYLACAKRLDWGYVDQPPLIALVAYLGSQILGDSLPAVRFLPSLAAGCKILLGARIASEFGGGVAAQTLTAVALLAAPGFLAIDSFLSMNAFEPLFWLGAAWMAIRLINGASPRITWLWFGVLAGLGLQNKHSMLIFGFAVLAGFVLTPERRLLHTRWLWAGGAIALLLILPNLVWNLAHGFPFLELQRNIRASGRNAPLTPLSFLAELALATNPVAFPIWIAGLWFLFFAGPRRYRSLGWAFVVTVALIIGLNPRVYYVFPALPIVLAAGSVALQRCVDAKPFLWWLVPAQATLLLAVAAAVAPLSMPLIPSEMYVRYSAWLGLRQPAIENRRLGPLPQLFADRQGWPQLADAVARAYHSLPPEVRTVTAIFGQNYGQAGAIDLFGARLGLPHALSAHQNYFLWGPGNYTGESMIVIGDNEQTLKRLFASVRPVASVQHPYAMPDQHVTIFHCQHPSRPLKEVWPSLKKWQ